MSADATTASFAPERRESARAGREAATHRLLPALQAAALAAIVGLSLFLVIVTADRPSGLAPTTHYGFYPSWMAGPLGGLWPSLTSNGTTLRWYFTIALVAMYCCYVFLLRTAPSLRVRWAVAAILAAHVVFVLAPPMALTDVFNYINYARMEVIHHLNPYTTTPISEPHDDPAFALSNWHQLLSPYGPMFTLITFVVVPLGIAGSFWALKIVFMFTSLAIIALVWKCAGMLGRERVRAIVLVGLNPIVLVWGLGGIHNDFLMVLSLMVGFYLLIRDSPGAVIADAEHRAPEEHLTGSLPARIRALLLPLSAAQIGAGGAFVFAASIKASAAILFPVLFIGLLRRPRAVVQVLIGMALVGIAVAALSLWAFGLHVPDLSTQSALVTQESVPNLVGLAVGAGGESAGVRIVMELALLASLVACCVYARRRRDIVTPSGWITIALLLTLSWVLPWYVLWVLPLAAMSGSARLRTGSLILGVYLIMAWSPASGLVFSGIGFHPQLTPLGRLHQRYISELLH